MNATATALEKIVVPLDGSELSEQIVKHVRRLLVRRDAPVALVRVFSRDEARAPGAAATIDAARIELERIVHSLRAQGATASAEVFLGPPAERILDFAKDWGASLIAMATHGRSGLDRLLRGSTAETVLRASTVPLLLATPRTPEACELRFKRILVPLDLSPGSKEILPLVWEIAALYDSEVVLLNVTEAPTPIEFPVGFERATGLDAERLLKETAEKLPGIKVFTTTDIGSPARSVMRHVEMEAIDLVAMTTHGRTGLARAAFGSVAEQVLRHVTCPLLVKRTV
jgi:nucleotide-binding universal stress UspA family protein